MKVVCVDLGFGLFSMCATPHLKMDEICANIVDLLQEDSEVCRLVKECLRDFKEAANQARQSQDFRGYLADACNYGCHQSVVAAMVKFQIAELLSFNIELIDRSL